jgi:hypothetical protein
MYLVASKEPFVSIPIPNCSVIVDIRDPIKRTSSPINSQTDPVSDPNDVVAPYLDTFDVRCA